MHQGRLQEEYTGNQKRNFGKYSQAMGHLTSMDCFPIISRDSHGITRTIKEAMYIWVNDPSLKRNIGKYQLLHTLDDKTLLHFVWGKHSYHLPTPRASHSPSIKRGVCAYSITLVSMIFPSQNHLGVAKTTLLHPSYFGTIL